MMFVALVALATFGIGVLAGTLFSNFDWQPALIIGGILFAVLGGMLGILLLVPA